MFCLYEVADPDRKLKPGWKVLVGNLNILAMLLECTKVVRSSRREKRDNPIVYDNRLTCRESYQFKMTLCVSMDLINSTLARVLPVQNDTLCEHGSHQFNLGESPTSSK